MTPVAIAALVVAAAAAVVDWIAVARGNQRLEYVAKPLTMAALVVVAATVDAELATRRLWFVAAAVLSLAGDVFLMLPRDRFIQGLVAFLLAHVCYIAGLVQLPLAAPGLAVGAVAVVIAVATVGTRVLRAVVRTHRGLLAPVVVYLVVISTMVVVAFATGPAMAAAGAVIFYASDSILAENRFVRPRAWAPLAVMVTYHVGQALLITSLVPR